MDATLSEDALHEELLSGDPTKQVEAIQKIIRLADEGTPINVNWPLFLTTCVTSKDSRVSTAAYGALPLCDASLAEWARITSSLMASLCSFDPQQRRAALEALPFFPTELMVDYDRPHNQLWIGGIAGEPDDVHLAAVRCMDRILFREDFVCGLPKLLYESWNFVVDRVLDIHAEPRAFWQPALCLLSKLFQRVFGTTEADADADADPDEDAHYFSPDEMRAALTDRKSVV